VRTSPVVPGDSRAGGDRVDAVGPPAQVDEPAAVRAEREGRQVVDRGDGERLRADRTAALDHHDVPFEELFDPEDVEVEAVAVDEDEPELPDSPFVPPEVSVEDFSALAAFLYDSLR
jgi:hypothetical protein